MEQLAFLDRFVRVYGFKNIADYETRITVSQFKGLQIKQNFLKQINNEMDNIKKYFKTGPLNLARKKYIIDSPELAMSILKKCLEQAGINYIGI